MRIGISLGDITGIGPEVTLKAIAAETGNNTRYLLIGDQAHLQHLNTRLGLHLKLTESAGNKDASQFQICDPKTEPLPKNLPPGHPAAARAAIHWLKLGAQKCLAGHLAALVTAPVNKESIIRAGEKNFVGQTELLSELTRCDRTAMMLLGCDDRGRWLRVALATNHLPIKLVADRLTQKNITRAAELAAAACRQLGLPRARVGICGLNPHAGEGGTIGDEEINIITPACDALRRSGLDIHGPFAADSLFYHAFRGEYDAVVAMYHDQGLAPLKMIGFEQGINWTLGLPFIRTSPDHGTAYDIAGKNLANPSSMIAALRLARSLAGG